MSGFEGQGSKGVATAATIPEPVRPRIKVPLGDGKWLAGWGTLEQAAKSECSVCQL